MVELVLQVARGEDDRLSGSVRVGGAQDRYEFSGMLELMRVFEELIRSDPPAIEGGGR
jgi:hypothetical protein